MSLQATVDPHILAVVLDRRARIANTMAHWLYCAPSQSSATGLFAAKSFAAGATIMENTSPDFYFPALSLADLQVLGLDVHHDCLQTGNDRYCLRTGNLDDFMNHSCDPNTGIKLTPAGGVFVALSDIRCHDEICYDYATYNKTSVPPFSCRCRSQNCRGVIGNFSELPESVRRRYLDLDIVGHFNR